MNRATQLALNAINAEFYARIAAEWSVSRRNPWPGFARILTSVEQQRTLTACASASLRVLDVGAGDGRFAAYLHGQWQGPLDYRGLDASVELRTYAEQRGLGAQFRFEHCDFVDLPPSAALPDGPFDLVTLLGVLHHVPASAARRELVRSLATRISATGLLALTIWHLPDDPRFAARVIDWMQYNARTTTPIALDQLEPGDTLLSWGRQQSPPRYCHFPSPQETETWLAACGLRVVSRFRADGRGDQLNEYLLLAR